jgi:mono/diheme cytochrome c family protein
MAAAEGTHAPWQRAALLRGAEIALLGAPMPARGTKPRSVPPAPTTAGSPCPTCPGGRAGPGGAYAFPRPANWPAGGGRGGGPGVRLSREPAALTRLAAGTGDLSGRAAKLLARISWPGKAGEPAPVAPLTAEEQQRFEAGQEVYRNLCQSCHQPDGRGQDKLAAGLVGSSMALAPADVPVRILLHGKEGAIGLMPPIGGTLNDEQVASVLTYIRREWGNTGAPVDAAAVGAVRAITTGRARPWTDAELLKLVPAAAR